MNTIKIIKINIDKANKNLNYIKCYIFNKKIYYTNKCPKKQKS